MPVILAGGIGSRLWPLSREAYPKHLLSFLGDNSLLQNTLLRAKAVPESSAPFVVSNIRHQAIIEEQLKQISVGDAHFILEPVRRNTAPAIAVAALEIKKQMGDALMLVLPADHIVQNIDAFAESVQAAKSFAEQGKLVTFGKKPEYAETGYGYIKRDSQLATHCYEVSQFVEKPDLSTAEQYCQDGGYDWNVGMFLFSCKKYLSELKAYEPKTLDACERALAHSARSNRVIELEQASFSDCIDKSVDFAVMEKTKNVVVVELKSDWKDAGSWQSLYDIEPHDKHANVVIGNVSAEDVEGCYLRSDTAKLAVVGVKDLVIVEEGGSVLIAHKNNVQDVKKLIKNFKKKEGIL